MRSQFKGMVVLVAAVGMLVPGAGRAGTAVDPEIVDPAGDVSWIPEGDLSFMDLRAAWFESIRDQDGRLEAFRVTIRTESPRPADKPLALSASWRVQGGSVPCTTEITVLDDTSNVGFIQWTAQAIAYSWCEGDQNVITLGPLTVVVLLDGREVAFARDGADYIVTVPIAAFNGSRADGLYGEGTVFEQAIINTFKVVPFAWIGVDYNQEARPFTLGS
ncbi:MAG TPA: hypothetical protein VGB64_05135 [Actinomycetota bacterium]